MLAFAQLETSQALSIGFTVTKRPHHLLCIDVRFLREQQGPQQDDLRRCHNPPMRSLVKERIALGVLLLV